MDAQQRQRDIKEDTTMPVTNGVVADGDLFGQAQARTNHPEQGPHGGHGDLRRPDEFGLTTAADGGLLAISDDGGVGRSITVNVAGAVGDDVRVQDPVALLLGGDLGGGAHHSGRHDAGSSSRRGAGQLGPAEEFGGAGRADAAAAFAPPARERRQPVQPMGEAEHAIVRGPAAVVATIHPAATAHRARRAGAGGAAPMRPQVALLAMLLGAIVIVGEPDSPWPRQLGAFLIWLIGCAWLFLPRRP